MADIVESGERDGKRSEIRLGAELCCWKPGQQLLPTETDAVKAELCSLYLEPGFY